MSVEFVPPRLFVQAVLSAYRNIHITSFGAAVATCTMTASLLTSSATQKAPPTHVIVVYTVVLLSMYGVYHSIAGRAFSVVMTFSVMSQCLAVVLLGLQSLSSNSASGISAQALVLEAFSLALRLSSTVWLDGYLPVDKTGDFLFQAVDVCSLVVVIWLQCFGATTKYTAAKS